MKKAKILAMTTAALLMAGCASDDEVAEIQNGKAIAFAATVESESRGSVVETAELQAQGFKLYANVVSSSSGKFTPLMEATPITWSAGNWSYSPIVYWPTEPDQAVDFYPVYTDANANVVYAWDKRPHITYSVPTNVDDQTDFLWAAPILGAKQSDYTGGAKVSFSFEHALSGIDVKILHNDYAGFIPVLKDPASYASNPSGDLSADFATLSALSDFHSSFKIDKLEIVGYFPAQGEIDPMATNLDDAWQFDIASTPWVKKTYTITPSHLVNVPSGIPGAGSDHEITTDGHIFLLPAGNINVDFKLTYSFEFNSKKYEYTLTKNNVACNFKPGEKQLVTLTPDCKKAPQSLKYKL